MSRSGAVERLDLIVRRRIRTPFEDRFGPLKNLMHTLDLVALEGQEQVMNKMLLILRRDVLRLVPPIQTMDVSRLADTMADLEHEAGQFAPMPRLFNGHVAAAIALLERTTIR